MRPMRRKVVKLKASQECQGCGSTLKNGEHAACVVMADRDSLETLYAHEMCEPKDWKRAP